MPHEPIERRRAVRGSFPYLEVAMDQLYPAEEVSRAAIFVRADPGRFEPGRTFEATMQVRGQWIACRLQVLRCETAPRRGVALRIADIAPDQARALDDAIDAARV